jgi:hypothetical protein
MKTYYILILAILTFFGCKQKQSIFTKEEFKVALSSCFEDKGFIAYGGFNSKIFNTYIIETNYELRDTLRFKEVDGVTFFINPVNKKYSPRQTIKVNLNYPDSKSARFNLIYTPSPLYQLSQTIEYKAIKNGWQIKNHNSIISDGDFKKELKL